LDLAYRELLRQLPLEPQHRLALVKRRFSDSEIQRRLYCTLPLRGRARIARVLVERFGAEAAAGVPGLYRVEPDGYWSLAGAPGLLIPVRTIQGYIVALKIRVDNHNDPGGKYRSLTSSHHNGPGSGSNLHVPMHDHNIDRSVLRLSEGELKSDAATMLSGILTVGIPGVSQWRKALPLLAVVKPKVVFMAFDQDWQVNRYVARALSDCASAVRKAGFHVEVESWPHPHKGVDDALAAGCMPVRQPFNVVYATRMRVTAKKICSLGSMINNRA
jgi:hypothetical protein